MTASDVTGRPEGAFVGSTVIVTGAAGGIGGAIARAFGREGATVIAADLRPPADLDRTSRYSALDVTDEENWIRLLDEVEAAHGGLDVLVNNAGYFLPNIAFEEMPIDVWRKHFAINSDGVFLGCKHAVRRMRTRRAGSIVNIGSGASIRPIATGSAYCGSKAAVLMTTRTAAASAGAHGIRVNAVLPGPVETAMLMGNVTEGDDADDFLARMADLGVLGTLATVDDIARAVLFLAGPASAAITGAYLPVDGGCMVGA